MYYIETNRQSNLVYFLPCEKDIITWFDSLEAGAWMASSTSTGNKQALAKPMLFVQLEGFSKSGTVSNVPLEYLELNHICGMISLRSFNLNWKQSRTGRTIYVTRRVHLRHRRPRGDER